MKKKFEQSKSILSTTDNKTIPKENTRKTVETPTETNHSNVRSVTDGDQFNSEDIRISSPTTNTPKKLDSMKQALDRNQTKKTNILGNKNTEKTSTNTGTTTNSNINSTQSKTSQNIPNDNSNGGNGNNIPPYTSQTTSNPSKKGAIAGIVAGTLMFGALALGQYGLSNKIDTLGEKVTGYSTQSSQIQNELQEQNNVLNGLVRGSVTANKGVQDALTLQTETIKGLSTDVKANGGKITSLTDAVNKYNVTVNRERAKHKQALKRLSKINNRTNKKLTGLERNIAKQQVATETLKTSADAIAGNVASLMAQAKPILVKDGPEYEGSFNLDGVGGIETIGYNPKTRKYTIASDGNSIEMDGELLLAKTLALFGDTTGKANGFVDNKTLDEGIIAYTGIKDSKAPLNLVAKLLPEHGKKYTKQEVIRYLVNMSLAGLQAKAEKDGTLSEFNNRITKKKHGFLTYGKAVLSPLTSALRLVTGQTTNNTYSKYTPQFQKDLMTIQEGASKYLTKENITPNHIRTVGDLITNKLKATLDDEILYNIPQQ